ncbi:sulfatase-like hydrolase/transferase [Winogradskyella sp.]|nr:sulfatase-like hydrolase/transferase [Winogradskyella sp.]
MKFLQLVLFVLIVTSCKCQTEKQTENKVEKAQPNILWIVTEDISPMLSFYGDDTAKTPNLDALAKESVVYDNAFAVVGVCGPSRSSIITGMYPTSIGTMHMRTGQDVMNWGKRTYKTKTNRYDLEGNEIVQYSAVIPGYVKCFTEYLRKDGYFTTNNEKTDYQFAAPITAWDENGKKAHWRNRNESQPFFSVFNFGTTHESRIWKNTDLPQTVDPKSVLVPPYFQDTETSRNDIARVYSNIELMDRQVGEIIQQLKDDGLYDNTIIFFYSDHGGPLPRQKREPYESGLHVPFMVKGLDGKIGHSEQMVSFVDLAPTVLSLANIKAPKHIQGKAFLGEYVTEKREVAYATSDRFDEFTDRSRTVYFDDFIYIKNDFPEKVWYKDVGYRKQVPMMTEMLSLREAGKLNETQLKWFSYKPKEELYNRKTDPHNLNNLAQDSNHKIQLEKGRSLILEFKKGQLEDKAMQPEAQMVKDMWPDFVQPITKPVTLSTSTTLSTGSDETSQGKTITLSSKTKGASIAYIISNELSQDYDFNSPWQLYSEPIQLKKGDVIYAIAERIGYKVSEITNHKVE